MLKKIKSQMVLIIVLLLAVGMSGCNQQTFKSDRKQEVQLYFYDEHQNTLVKEKGTIDVLKGTSNEVIMLSVIELLAKGPESSNQGVRPIQFNMDQPILKEKTVFINFNQNYNKLSVAEQIIQRAQLVCTLTELDFVEGVEFFIEDSPLMNSNGDKIGLVTRKNILINPLNPTPPTSSKMITLYFPDQEGKWLYKEEREIQVNTNIALENYVLQELVKGPVTEGLVSPLPPDTKINDIKTQDLVCQVDLSYDLQTLQVSNLLNEEAIIYSMVNSLTELPKIQKVVFLKDGKKQTEFTTPIDTGGTFERKEEFIAPTS